MIKNVVSYGVLHHTCVIVSCERYRCMSISQASTCVTEAELQKTRAVNPGQNSKSSCSPVGRPWDNLMVLRELFHPAKLKLSFSASYGNSKRYRARALLSYCEGFLHPVCHDVDPFNSRRAVNSIARTALEILDCPSRLLTKRRVT